MAEEQPYTPSRRTHYWQLPLFTCGLIAAGVAYAQFPPTSATAEEKFALNVKKLAGALERKPVDAEYLDGLAMTVSSGLTPTTPDAAQLYWLTGSAYVMSAEADDSRMDRWKQADECYRHVKPEQFDHPDKVKLFVFRHAKVRAATGQGEPKQIIAALIDVPVGEDSEGERRRLLATTYLRDTPPNLRGAQAEFTAFLAGPTRRPATALAQDRLTLARICMQMGDQEKARAVLKDIGSTAPPEIIAEAKVQLAKLAVMENHWHEAIQYYEEALVGTALTGDARQGVQLFLAEAYNKHGDLEAAKKQLATVATGAGSAAQAANFLQASLELSQPDQGQPRTHVVELLQAGARAYPGSAEFDATYMTLANVRDVFERTVQTCTAEGDFASAVNAATIYSPWALPGRATELKAQTNSNWAAALKANPQNAAQADAKYSEAAADYAALATTFPTPAGKAELWKRAAQYYRQAGDEKSATHALNQLMETPGLPDDVVAAAWVEKGESLLAGNNFQEGVTALRQAMEKSSPAAASARVRLAVAHLDEARTKSRTPETVEQGKALQKQGEALLLTAVNLKPTSPIEKEAHHQALFELGKLNLNQGQLIEAETRFRQLLAELPNEKLVGQTKLYLGSSLLLAARGDGTGRPPVDSEKKLTEAVALFTELSNLPDGFLRTQADIRLANATLLLRKYGDMPELCEKLSHRYENKIEELIIRSMLYTAYRFADRSENAATTLARMEELFLRLPDEAFPGGADEYTRAYWQKQWFDPLKAKP